MNRGWIVVIIVVPFLFGGLICAGCVWLALDLQQAAARARHAQLRMLSGNNLKTLVLALQNYHDTYQQYPPAVVTDATGRPLYSGRVLLLPFIEQQTVFEQFDHSRAWDSPENLALSQTRIKAFESPHKPAADGRCDYVFVTGPGTAFPTGRTTNYGDMQDGTAQTLVMIETSNGPASWAAPGDWDASSGPIPPAYMTDQTLVGFADGKVISLRTDPSHPQSRALCTIAGGESVPVEQIVADRPKAAAPRQDAKQ